MNKKLENPKGPCGFGSPRKRARGVWVKRTSLLCWFLARRLAICQPIVWPIQMLLTRRKEGIFSTSAAQSFLQSCLFYDGRYLWRMCHVPSSSCCRRLAFIKYLLPPSEWSGGLPISFNLGCGCGWRCHYPPGGVINMFSRYAKKRL